MNSKHMGTDENFNVEECGNVKSQIEPIIIGIVAQEAYSINTNYLKLNKNCVDKKNYVAASYVKFLKKPAVQVVFIMIGQSDEYYENILSQVHGVLFPGGATWLHEKNGYGDAGKIIFKIAMERRIPILAICLGMHLLSYADSGDADKYRSECDFKMGELLPLNLTSDYRSSELFKTAPDKIINLFKNKNLNYYFHRFCVTEEILEKCKIRQNWRVLATETDEKNNKRYISVMESVKYPIWGVQFHPEKLLFESKVAMLILNEEKSDAESVNDYYSNFIVDKARYYKQQSANENRTGDLEFSNSYKPFERLGDEGAFDEIYVFDKLNSI